MIPFAKRKVLIIAHRGASAVAPESTRAAIREAARSGAQMIELDVQMTRDGRLIIFHDDRLERTTDGSGWVRRCAYPHLARLDAGAWFSPRFAGQRILLVSQALRLIPSHMRVNLEVKPTTHGQALLRRLWRIVRRARLGRRLLVSSGDAALLQRLGPSRVEPHPATAGRHPGSRPAWGDIPPTHSLAQPRGAPQRFASPPEIAERFRGLSPGPPFLLSQESRGVTGQSEAWGADGGVETALICHSRPDRSLQQAIRLRCMAWHPWHALVSPRRLQRAHAAGLRIHAWTVDDLRRARQLIRWGIDGLFTNHPTRLCEALHLPLANPSVPLPSLTLLRDSSMRNFAERNFYG